MQEEAVRGLIKKERNLPSPSVYGEWKGGQDRFSVVGRS